MARPIGADGVAAAIAFDHLAGELRQNGAYLERLAAQLERQANALTVAQTVVFGPPDGVPGAGRPENSYVELDPQPRMRSMTIHNPTGIVVYGAQGAAAGYGVPAAPDFIVPPMSYLTVPYAGAPLTLATDPILATVERSTVLVMRSELPAGNGGALAGSLGISPLVEVQPYTPAELAAMGTLPLTTNGVPCRPITLSRWFRRIAGRIVVVGGTGQVRVELESLTAPGTWISSAATALTSNTTTNFSGGTLGGGVVPFRRVRFRVDNTDAVNPFTAAGFNLWLGQALD